MILIFVELVKIFYLSLQDVDEALRRLPQEEVDARTQRLKRAMDLSLKHVYLPKELQAVQTPYNSYVMVRLLQKIFILLAATSEFLPRSPNSGH